MKIHKMASTFNEMLDTVEEVFIHEKQFSSDVSHELRTPITVILAQVIMLYSILILLKKPKNH
ncbi:hypothetical protein FPOG_01532 [Fusobacterium periodonticum D10]|uniref:Signal transduction histidine kinase dimerisation/phosphoacceptor domain-containing protein n=1 Tax=Fusobacterium periodonticum D10 TaxID=620833 RepID=K1GWI5_9FUSO|nr:hypothetical protein FPOG_01532 [Fusobacterium periodonticum D10]